MNQPATGDSCAGLLKALADETRLAVVDQLMSGPRNVTQINAELRLDPTLLSHHLRVLREAGIVQSERVGKQQRYTLAPTVRRDRVRGVDLGCCSISFKQQPLSARFTAG